MECKCSCNCCLYDYHEFCNLECYTEKDDKKEITKRELMCKCSHPSINGDMCLTCNKDLI